MTGKDAMFAVYSKGTITTGAATLNVALHAMGN